MIDASSAFLLLITIFVFFLPLLIYFPPVPPSQRDALLETHSPIGLQSTRKDASAGAIPVKNGSKSLATIRNLWIYPVKSCKGIEVSQSKVLPTGLEFDRLYTFAQLKSRFPVGVQHASDEDNKQAHAWEFITQRQFPLLATVQVDLFVPDIIKARGRPSPSKVSDAFLLVSFPWQEPGLRGVLSWVAAKIARASWRARPEKELVLPVTFPPQEEIEARGYTHEQVTIWRDTATALNMERELPRELQLYLGVSNKLGIFRIDPARLRHVYRCAPNKVVAGYQPVVGFQDAVRIFIPPFSLPPPPPRSVPINGPISLFSSEGLTVDGECWKTLAVSPASPKPNQRSRFRCQDRQGRGPQRPGSQTVPCQHHRWVFVDSAWSPT
jgi:hypothetical protein